MRKLSGLILLASVLMFNNSCKNDLDALAPYKESVSVYGLLDQNDTANYIRVNRVFLGEGDANQIATIADSVYFKPDEASVIVEKYWNGSKRQTYVFHETYEKPLEPGVFNTNQLIYKSTEKFKCDSAGKTFEYKLVVRVNKTGNEYTATTKLIKDMTPTNVGGLCNASIGQSCFFNMTSTNIPYVPNAKCNIKFIAPPNCGICDVNTAFYYHALHNDSSKTKRMIDYEIPSQKTDNTGGGQIMDFSFPGLNFYEVVAAKTVSETNLYERVPDSMAFTFIFAGTEYSLYREINNTTGSFGQEKPIYTNISNGGVGVFSSRTKIRILRGFYDCTGPVNQTGIMTYNTTEGLMFSGKTCHLMFTGEHCSHNVGC